MTLVGYRIIAHRRYTLVLIPLTILCVASVCYVLNVSINMHRKLLGSFEDESQFRISSRDDTLKREKVISRSMFATKKVENLEIEEFDHRVIIITHLVSGFDAYGSESSYMFVFGTMLHASWKYVLKHYDWTQDAKMAVKADLFVYYDSSLDATKLPWDCHELSGPESIKPNEPSRCYRRRVPETRHTYTYVNNFAFLQDPDLPKILQKYHFVLRTDPDCFVTPNFFSWKLSQSIEIVFNEWSYINDVSEKMLQKISSELGYRRHRSISSIGSTWYVSSRKFLQLCHKVVFATTFIFNHGWNPQKYPLIRPYVLKDAAGQWPEWYLHVSLLYGSDIAIHDLFEKLKVGINQRPVVDVDTHEKSNISGVYHLHAIHGDPVIPFDKFAFFQKMHKFCTTEAKLSQEFVEMIHNELNVKAEVEIESMTAYQYAQLISLHGAMDYILQNGCFSNFIIPW